MHTAAIEGEILLWLAENRTPMLDRIMMFITSLGDHGKIWIVISLALMIPKRTRKIGFMCGLSLIFSLLINNVLLKNIVRRTRPFDAVEGLVSLKAPGDYSFPSGHTGGSFCTVFTLLARLPKRYGIPAVVLASLIAFSRLYIGVHYPTDVLGGIITGLISSYLAQLIIEKLYKKYGGHKSNGETAAEK